MPWRCALLYFHQSDTLLLHIEDDVGPVTLRSVTGPTPVTPGSATISTPRNS
jgi:hypothetical protein